MRKKGTIAVIAIICIGIVVFSYVIKMNKYDNSIADLSYDTFTEHVSYIEKGMISGDQAILINGMIYYTDLQSGTSIPLCTKSDCNHNNTEECMACFSSDCDLKSLYCYDGKMYVIGYTQKKIRVYRSNLDGSEHELITEYELAQDQIHWFYSFADTENDILYMAVSIADNSSLELDENGNVPDVPLTLYFLSYDYNTQKIQELAVFPQQGYQLYAEFRELRDNKLYYDVGWLDVPRNSELTEEDYAEHEITEAGYINLADCELVKAPEYHYGDFIGETEYGRYYVEYSDRLTYSGDIRIEQENKENEILHMEDLEHADYAEKEVIVLNDEIILKCNSVNEDECGKTYFYDLSGNLIQEVENNQYWILGEYENYYILGSAIYNNWFPQAVVRKDKIENIDRNYVLLYPNY